MAKKRIPRLELLLCLGLASTWLGVRSLGAHEQHNTHPRLTNAAVVFWIESGGESSFLTESRKQQLTSGTVEEDSGFYTTSLGSVPRFCFHFFNPVTGQNLIPGLNPLLTLVCLNQETALTAQEVARIHWDSAVALYPDDAAFFQLGRVLHLVQDMTSPAHISDDPHGGIGSESCSHFGLLGNVDDFENWGWCVADSSFNILDYGVGGLPVPALKTTIPGPIVPPDSTPEGVILEVANRAYDLSTFYGKLTLDSHPSEELTDTFEVSDFIMGPGFGGWVIANVGLWRGECGGAADGDDSWWAMRNPAGGNAGPECTVDLSGPEPTAEGRFHLEESAGVGSDLVPRVWLKPGFLYSEANERPLLRLYGDIMYSLATAYGAGLLDIFWSRCESINDDFIQSEELVGLSGVVSENSECASAQPGELLHAGSVPRKSLWWRYHASEFGRFTLSTVGSSIDTVLAAYVGFHVSNLLEAGSANNPGSTEQIEFVAIRGNTFHVAVDAVGDGGHVVLSWDFEPFATDLGDARWAEPYIIYLYLLEVVNGDTPTTFSPGRDVNRAEALKIAYDGARIVPDPAAPDPGFSDVNPNNPDHQWFYPYVFDAVERGYIEGRTCESGSFGFCPGEAVSRYEAAKILHAVFEDVNYSMIEDGCPQGQYLGLFPDVPQEAWYCLPVEWLGSTEVIWNGEYRTQLASGYSVVGLGNYFGGDQVDGQGDAILRSINRAEMARIVANAMNYKGTGPNVVPLAPGQVLELGRAVTPEDLVALGKEYEQDVDASNVNFPDEIDLAGGNVQVVAGPVTLAGDTHDTDGDELFYYWASTGGTFEVLEPVGLSAVRWHPPGVSQDTTFVVNVFQGDRRGGVSRNRFEFTVLADVGGQPSSGTITAPNGTQTDTITVEANASDADGLVRLSVSFVNGGGELDLCGGSAPACNGTSGTFGQSNIDPSAFGASAGSVTLRLYVEDSTGARQEVDQHTFTYDPPSQGSGFTLTVTKQGTGDGLVSGGGINCPVGCVSDSTTVPEGQVVTITGSGFEWIGFGGDVCFGASPCSLTMISDRNLRATFATPETFQADSSIPSDGDTGAATSDNVRVMFNRPVLLGPNVGAIGFSECSGPAVDFNPLVQTAERRLILNPTGSLMENTCYLVSVPAGAVTDDQGELLPNPFDFSFTTGSPGDPKIFITAYPTRLIEGRETTVHIWFDRPQPFNRTVSLQSTPSGTLVHPSQVVIPAGEIFAEIVVDSDFDHGNLSDVSVELTALEAGDGIQDTQVISVKNRDNSPGSVFRYLAGSLIDDDGNNGVFDAGEDAKFLFQFRNSGTSPIATDLEIEVLNANSFDLQVLNACNLGTIPGQTNRDCEVDFRADSDIPTGQYFVRLRGTSNAGTPGAFTEFFTMNIVNNALPNLTLTLAGGSTLPRDPGESFLYDFVARNRGDGFNPTLPFVEVRTDIDGVSTLLASTFVDVRGEIFASETIFFALVAPNTPGDYTVTGTIDPDGVIPETTTADNSSSFLLRVVGPNRPPVLDPLPTPVGTNVGSPLTFTATATDPDGDPLAFRLGPGAPPGASIGAISGIFTWTPACGVGSNFQIDVIVEDNETAADSQMVDIVVGLSADLRIEKIASTQLGLPGEQVGFMVAVTNDGPSCVSGVTVNDAFSSSLGGVSWTCSGADGGVCQAAGDGDILDTAVDLPSGASVTYAITATLATGALELVENTASVQAPADATDPNGTNNQDQASITIRDLDYGDAPDSSVGSPWNYPTRLSDDGARHAADTALILGAAIDGEADGQPGLSGLDDDTNGTPDEDGVNFVSQLLVCQSTDVEVEVSAAGFLDTWIDFNADGDWLDEGEQMFTSEALVAGVNTLGVSVPCSATPTALTYARFRLSSSGDLSPHGLAIDGEVEDYRVSIAQVFYTLGVVHAGSGDGLVLSAPAGIDCGTDCLSAYPLGTQVTLTSNPDLGSSFTGWNGGGCSGMGSCVVTMDADKVVTANFELVDHTVSVSLAGDGAGTVTSSPAGIACDPTCAASFPFGTMLTLMPQAATGSVFSGWSGGCSGSGVSSFSVEADSTCTATFDLIDYPLTVVLGGDGNGTVTSDVTGIDCAPDCTEDYPFGTEVTLTATPEAGSEFTGWSDPGCLGTAPCMVTMAAATTVTATFAAIDHTLSVSLVGDGGGIVMSNPVGIDCGADCVEVFAWGTEVTLTPTADADSLFVGWDDPSCPDPIPCTVTMGQDRMIEATFALNTFTLTVTRDGAGNGTVTSDPTGIDCGEDCDEAFGNGAMVTLTANAGVGSAFMGWDDPTCLGLAPCVVLVEDDVTVTATFGITCEDDLEEHPGNWTTAVGPNDGGGTQPWELTTSDSHSGVQSWFAAEEDQVKDQLLLTTFTTPLLAPGATLRFWHQFDTELGFDGGVLEISVDGGAWQDILDGNAGRFLLGAYNSALDTCCANPLAGRQAWSGDSSGWQEAIVDLSDFAGHSIAFRWRMGSDDAVSPGTGWWMDDVAILDAAVCPLWLIFGDGFESGNTSAWSSTSP